MLVQPPTDGLDQIQNCWLTDEESHGCCKASLAVGRFRGLISSKFFTKSRNNASEA
ncbi:hypothetical protein Hanom_Chr08g00711791 [Helianthus anomalus]